MRTLTGMAGSIGLVSWLALAAQPGWAQAAGGAATPATADTTAVNSDTDANGEILVTARRRQESAQTVPISITAFGEAQLREKAIRDTSDLTYVAPGINVAPQTSRDTPAIVIRGQRRSVSGAGSPSVVTYFADVPLPNEGSIVSTFDIASLQVLKGPQGTLFGRNTIGGALLVYPNAPGYRWSGYAQGTLGSYGQRDIEGAVNVPIIDDHVAVRVAGQRVRRDGYTRNLGIGGDLDDRHNDAVRGSLLLQPITAVKNATVVDYYKATEHGTGLVLNGVYPNPAVPGGGTARTTAAKPFYDCGVAGCDIDIALAQQQQLGPRTTNTSIAPVSNRTFWGVANTTTADFGAVSFKNIFGLRRTTVYFQRDYDGSALQLYEGRGRIDSKQVSDEAQLLGKLLDGKLDWIVGGFYLKSTPDGINFIETRSAVLSTTVFRSTETYISARSRAVFDQIGYDFGGFNVAGYIGKYSNIQRTLTTGANLDGDNNPANDPTSLTINAAKATISGVEFDGSVTPVRWLTLSGFGAYTDAHYDKYDAIPIFVPLLGTNPVDNKFSYTPKWTLGAAARISRTIGSAGELAFNANYFWSGKVWYVKRPLDTNGIQNSYDLVNTKLDLQNAWGSGVDVGLFVRNVFNKTFAAAGGVVTPAITATTLVYNEPRVFGIELRWSFGR